MVIQQVKLICLEFYKLRYYIVLAALIFIIGIVIGYKSSIFHDFLQGQIEGLAEVAGGLFELDNAELWIFLFIFLNNAIKSILIIYLGLFFGLLPVVFLLINGMVLGYLYYYVVILNETLTAGELLVGILPHGIIELPVITIACAYGIRMGSLVWKKLFGWVGPEPRSKGELTSFLVSTPRIIIFITITLLLAAAIEATITPWLMNL